VSRREQTNIHESAERNRLLQLIHIAYPQCGLTELAYRDLLREQFGKERFGGGKPSATFLTIFELQFLVEHFKIRYGWQPRKRTKRGIEETGKRGNQAERLRERAVELAGELENGEARLLGLVRKMCGVDRLEWARDASKLRRLLAVMERIKRV